MRAGGVSSDPLRATGDFQLTQEKIADSWIQIEQFRLLVLRTAWKIDRYHDYQKVRRDIAAVKVAMPTVLHDVVMRAMQRTARWACPTRCRS